MGYVGEKCPVCNKIFTPDDDIVVCPDCGTPHHRDCYTSTMTCANAGFHAEGRKWEKATVSGPRYRICPVCRFSNSEKEESCQRCGTDLRAVRASGDGGQRQTGDRSGSQWNEGFPIPDADELIDPINYLGYDQNEDMGGATMREVSDFVGPNTIYYLPKFKRLKEDGVRPSFNILGLIFPSLFFANRRMWGWAIITVVVGTLLGFPSDLLIYLKEYAEELPAELANFLSDNTKTIRLLGDIGLALNLSARALICFFSNWLYYRFTMRSIKKIKMRRGPASQIKSSGGIKPLNVIFIMLIRYGVTLIAFAALFFCVEFVFTFREVYKV